MAHRVVQGFVLLAASVVMAGTALAGGLFEDVGYADLVARLGEGNVPTGAGIGVGQVEAPAGSNYGPNQANPQFAGKTFIPMSGPPGSSAHATTVATFYYGNSSSIAFGITDIWLWEASNWLQSGYLNAQAGGAVAPLLPPEGLRMFNHSWVGTTGDGTLNNTVLRRADFAVRRDDTLMFNGMNNAGGVNQPLMAYSYNGIAVGRADGEHVSGPTPAGVDGPGRQKPEIVAPGSATSYSTPVVAAAAALLLETAATDPALSINPNADEAELVKAVLLAGAVHREGWSNNPDAAGPTRGVTSTPLDSVYGVDLLNVNRSHLILTGGEHDGADAPEAAPVVDGAGWDLIEVPAGESRWWTFAVDAKAAEVAVVVTWNRVVSNTFGSFTLADFDLRLWRLDELGQPQTLVGDAGLPYFAGGNVVSQSAVDNVEHLYVTGLAAGMYLLELDRQDLGAVPTPAAVAWLIPEVDAGVPGDLDGNGIVDGADLGFMLSAWGTSDPIADLDGTGVVDGADLGILLSNWS